MFPEKRNPLDFFKKKQDPKELVRKWQSDMRSEQRRLERSIMNIQREEKLAQKQVITACSRPFPALMVLLKVSAGKHFYA